MCVCVVGCVCVCVRTYVCVGVCEVCEGGQCVCVWWPCVCVCVCVRMCGGYFVVCVSKHKYMYTEHNIHKSIRYRTNPQTHTHTQRRHTTSPLS